MTGDYTRLPVDDAGIGIYRVRPGSTGRKILRRSNKIEIA